MSELDEWPKKPAPEKNSLGLSEGARWLGLHEGAGWLGLSEGAQ